MPSSLKAVGRTEDYLDIVWGYLPVYAFGLTGTIAGGLFIHNSCNVLQWKTVLCYLHLLSLVKVEKLIAYSATKSLL